MRIWSIWVIRLQYRLMVVIIIVLTLILWVGLIRLRKVLVVMFFRRDDIFASSISVFVVRDWILRFIMLVVIIRIADVLDRVGRLWRQPVGLSYWHLHWRLLRSVRSVFELVAMKGPAWGRRSTRMTRVHGVSAVLFVFWVLVKGVYWVSKSACEGSMYVVCEQSGELRAGEYIPFEQRFRGYNKRVIPKRLYDMAGGRHKRNARSPGAGEAKEGTKDSETKPQGSSVPRDV